MVYLDYAATTPVNESVQRAIQHTLQNTFGNPSSIHRLGKDSKRQLTKARERLAHLFGVKHEQIFFTSGATESNYWAIMSQAYQARELGFGNHIIVTGIEHPSVYEVCQTLARNGFEIDIINPNERGIIDESMFVAMSKETTIGWIAMAVNNEVASRLPVELIGKAAHDRGVWFHVDAVQWLGHESLLLSELNCTSCSISGHKIYAPKGIGCLIYTPWRKEMKLQSLLVGGGQEQGYRAGTENTAYIQGLQVACDELLIKYEELQNLYKTLSQRLYTKLDESGIAYERNGGSSTVDYIHSLWLKGYPADRTLILLDLAGVYISAGSACSAGSLQPSRVLQAYYPNNEARWRESVRISFGEQTTLNDIDRLVEELSKILK